MLLLHFKHQLPRDLTLPAFHAVTGCGTASNALANPVPQEDANADKTTLHVFHRAAVGHLHVAVH